MTIVDLLRACRRRWPVLALGIALTIAAILGVRDVRGVYWAQADLALLAPQSVHNPNALANTSSSLIAMAAVLERDFNQGHEDPATASSQVSLVDEGVARGVSVQLPNAGGQWTYYFSTAVLSVQVVGPSSSEVATEMSITLRQLTAMLEQRQEALGVAKVNQVSASVRPAAPEVSYAVGARGQAIATVYAVGLVSTLAAVVLTDGWVMRRRGRSGRRPGLGDGRSGPDNILISPRGERADTDGAVGAATPRRKSFVSRIGQRVRRRRPNWRASSESAGGARRG